ncbi:hypothetical protein CSUI_005103 [Cystoisospora suis]|uniref:Transmembrane protein n=1 Tax=Cystoisospora suis TaxID=483139 RepID=A0A2C6KY90_9APIC|nr:hypothetical protein CSUI_005103 [Cystoisospora suis]
MTQKEEPILLVCRRLQILPPPRPLRTFPSSGVHTPEGLRVHHLSLRSCFLSSFIVCTIPFLHTFASFFSRDRDVTFYLSFFLSVSLFVSSFALSTSHLSVSSLSVSSSVSMYISSIPFTLHSFSSVSFTPHFLSHYPLIDFIQSSQ